MTNQASRTFEVKLPPQAQDAESDDSTLGRMLINIADGKHSYDFKYTLATESGC